MTIRMAFACVLLAALASSPARAEAASGKVDPWVLETSARGQTEFLVMLRSPADLRGARSITARDEKAAFVADTLRANAEATQAPLLRDLAARGVAHRAFWVANMIWVRGDHRLVEELAARDDVFHIYANPRVRFSGPVNVEATAAAPRTKAAEAIEWGVARVHAPEVWALGFQGQGVVVAGQDTGYSWTHPAIQGKYRGWNGSSADHDYNWHDAIHSGGGVCGFDSPEPCDDDGHGTHTMGTIVGDDGGANQIGVAPGAKWIGCRNMDVGVGTPATYAECFQWFIAPTDLGDENPDPSKAPDVINNSWGCPPSEGCTDPAVLQAVVENTRAAGIEVVVSAGNAGSACGTVEDPAAIYDASFSVGATGSDPDDTIASFSSRGPVTIDGSNRPKPDISAPGVGVRSSLPGGGYGSLSGTSMAGPHVVGVVALVLSANPALAGHPDEIESLLTSSALPRTASQACGGVPGTSIPNNTYGWGRVDALGALQGDIQVTQTDSPDPTLPGVAVTFSVTVSNVGTGPVAGVTLSEGLTITATVDSATPSQGSCTLLPHGVTCNLGSIAAGGSATVQIVGTPSAAGTLTSTATAVISSGADANPSNNTAQVTTAVSNCPFPSPSITAPASVPPSTEGMTASANSGPGHTATWMLTGGAITAGQGTGAITFTSGDPGTTMNLSVVDSLAGCEAAESSVLVSVDFLDVPPSNTFHDFVNALSRNGVTTGCGSGYYCGTSPVTRAQMAILLLKARFTVSHTPPPATGLVFLDVPQGSPGADWIEELHGLGITSGCGNGQYYCPTNPVTRAQMAILLLRTLHDSSYAPAPATGTVFADVPADAFAADFIEDLYRNDITTGCLTDPLRYCPGNPNNRQQMAAFLVRTFSLP